MRICVHLALEFQTLVAESLDHMNKVSVFRLTPARVIAGAVVVSCRLSTSAQSLEVANPSFESPQIPTGFPALTVVSGWQKNPAPPPEFGIPAEQWDQLAGIFPNPAGGQPRHLTNADGNQVGYLFAVQGVGISQELTTKFTVGVNYELQVGLRGGGALIPGTQFQVGLYYTVNGAQVPISSVVISATDELTTASALRDIQVSSGTVKASDPWNGHNLGVSLNSISQNGGPGIAYWEVDKVAVTATPEPSTWMLGGMGAVLLCAAGWRRRQS